VGGVSAIVPEFTGFIGFTEVREEVVVERERGRTALAVVM
jgi:hypothetical protein